MVMLAIEDLDVVVVAVLQMAVVLTCSAFSASIFLNLTSFFQQQTTILCNSKFFTLLSSKLYSGTQYYLIKRYLFFLV